MTLLHLLVASPSNEKKVILNLANRFRASHAPNSGGLRHEVLGTDFCGLKTNHQVQEFVGNRNSGTKNQELSADVRPASC
jgi:hypothetical protein